MPVAKAKPTSPGRRFVVSVKSPELHKGAPYKPLLEKQSKTGGRNNAGRIASKHDVFSVIPDLEWLKRNGRAFNSYCFGVVKARILAK